MAEKRVSRKELLKKPDEFLSFSERAYEYIATHSKQFTAGLVGFAVAVLIYVGIVWYIDYRADQAMVAYNAAADLAENNQPFDPQKGRDAVQALEKFRQDFSSSHQADLALIQLGDLYYQLGQYDQAESAYQEFLKKISEANALLKPFVLSSLAQVYEAQKKPEQAVATWSKILAMKEEAMKEEAYIGLGRLYQAQEKYEEAKKAYQDLVDKFPSSRFIDLAQSELANIS